MRQYRITEGGVLLPIGCEDFTGQEIDANLVSADHLASNVETYTLSKGDLVKVLVSYSCHCWSSAYDPASHTSDLIRINDGAQQRVHDPARHELSYQLPELIRQLTHHNVYVTASERNYGCYNAKVLAADGLFYTAYFTVRRDKGRFNGIRHSLRLNVESAYLRVQPDHGSRTSINAIVAAALDGRVIKYKR